MRLSVSTAGCMNVSSPKIVYVACCIYCVDRVCCMLYSLCWRSMLHTVSSALTCMLHAVSSAKTGYATYCIFCIDGYSACCISWKYVICSMLYPLRWQGMHACCFCGWNWVCCMPLLLLWQGILHTVSTANTLNTAEGVCCLRYQLKTHSMMHAVFSAYAAWRGMPLQTMFQLLLSLSPRFPGGTGVH